MIARFKPTYLNSVPFNKIEPFLFSLLLVIGTLPLLFSRYFVTLDGPAHLYNANLIKEILLGNTAISDLFVLNKFPVPNWSGHFLMALLRLFLPAFLAEKTVYLLYFVLTPLFFRKFLLHFYPGNKAITYLILLFVHNHNLYFGFLNMSLGIMFLFITAYYFVKYCNEIRLKNILVLSFLLLTIYFSHVLIMLVTLMVLTVALVLLAKTLKTADGISIINTAELKKRMILLVISAVPAVTLTCIYFFSIDSIEKGSRLESNELINYIIDIRPLLTLCYCKSWTILTHILAGLFLLLILSNVYMLVKNTCSFKGGQLHFQLPLHLSILWSSIGMVFLTLFLIIPNSILMSERLILLFFVFFIIWLASLKYPSIVKVVFLVAVIFLHNFFVHRHFEAMIRLSKDAEKIEQAAGKIKPNSIVLTFNYSENWLHSHITGYLGSDRAIAVLENYEAALRWFPLQWNTTEYQTDRLIAWGVDNKQIANDYYINKEDTTCFSLIRTNGNLHKIPYVFVLNKAGNMNEIMALKIKDVLAYSYIEIYTTDLCSLYELKPMGF